MNLPPGLRLFETVRSAHSIFKNVLGSRTPDAVFNEGHLTVSDDWKRLYEFTGNRGELAEAVFGADFPRLQGPIDLDHYTTMGALRGIVASRSLRLRPVANHIPNHEFVTYVRAHGLDGYLDTDKSGKPVYEALAEDLFYLSATSPGHPNEAGMWDEFASDGRGVRLGLRITPAPAVELRSMGYQGGRPTAFERINADLGSQLGLSYLPWGISRICAFYLPQSYGDEREARLMAKLHRDGLDRTATDGSGRFWPVELVVDGEETTDPCGRIELVTVTPGPRCRKETVVQTLQGTPYADVTVG